MMGVIRSKEFLLERRQYIVICNLHHECMGMSNWKLHGYPSK